VTVIDGATDTVIATVNAGMGPKELCYDPTYNKVYCSNMDVHNITVIDGTTNGIIATIGVGDGPIALARDPAQNRVYVANYFGSSISVLRDSGGVVGMEESFKPQTTSRKPMPTIIRGVLALPVSPRPRVAESPCLLDACGRKVMDLHAGANDVRALAPGVYFVREQPQAASLKPQAVRKVVITR
jgi:YVTN family beta-propeller protein